MDKPAPTDHPVHPLIADRWSARAFDQRSVSEAAVASLLEAARWAPSSFNEQPWSFVVARREDAGEFERVLGCLMEANQAWARRAAVLMLSVARLTFARNGKPNKHALHDVGLAMGNLTIQATEMGLNVHQMAGFDGAKARERFEIPEEFEPVAVIAVGYRDSAECLPEKFRDAEHAPRTRKPFAEMWWKKS